jgi:methyltransferase
MYYLFIIAIGAERLIEMVVSRRNANWSFANGGKEFGRGHFPVLVGMHTLLLVACIAEVALFTAHSLHGSAGRWWVSWR